MKAHKIISRTLVSIIVLSTLLVVCWHNTVISCINISTISLVGFQVGITVQDDRESIENITVKEWIVFALFTAGIIFSYKIFTWNIIAPYIDPNRKVSFLLSFLGFTWFVPFYLGHWAKRFSLLRRHLAFEV